MRYLSALLAAVTLASFSNAVPLTDFESTTMTIGNSKQALDKGHLTIQLSRVDDLVDEQHNALLLERITHIALDIQLHPKKNCMSINGQEHSLTDVSGDPSVSIVKAEAFKMGENLPSSLYMPENVEAMVQKMSKGIVAVEVMIQSEEHNVAVGLEQDGQLLAVVEDDNISMRRLGLFVKIHEVEGLDLAHDTLVYAPILQLLVKSDNSIPGRPQVVEVTTLSIAGEPVVEDAVPGLSTLEDVSKLLPSLEDLTKELPAAFPSHHDHDSALYGWLAALFGEAREEKPIPKMRYGLAAAGMNPDARFRKGKALAPEFQRGQKHHGHHKHGKQHHDCFRRRFKNGLRMVFHSMVYFFTQTVTGAVALGAILGGILFSITRRTVQYFRKTDYTDVMSYDDDKVYLVIEDENVPPTYEDHRATSPLFDADAEARNEKN